MKKAYLIPGTDKNNKNLWVWMDAKENCLTQDFNTKEEALSNKPQGYTHCDDTGEEIEIMFKGFANEINSYEIKIFKGSTFICYFQDKALGFTFGKWSKDIKEMGYSSTQDAIKKMKSRGLLGEEVNSEEQRQNVIRGWENLLQDRIKNGRGTKDVIEMLESLK